MRSTAHARYRPARVAPLAALLLLAAGCGEPALEWREDGDVRWRELRVRGEPIAGFTRLDGPRTGVVFVNDPSDEMLTLNQHLANGAGVALGDVDADGRVDILLAHTRGENALYLNRGDLRFEEVGEGAGVRTPGKSTTGVALADVDGDGDLDALLSAMGGPVTLLLNDGSGVFSDRSAGAGFEQTRAGSTLALADIDRDGDLDLYAANYRLRRAADVFSPADRRETPVLEHRGGDWVVNEMYRDFYRVVIGPEGVMSWEFGEADDLYLNDGSGAFERVAVRGPRFRGGDGRPLEDEPREWGLAARFGDLDGDGDPDLYVANDFESPDYVWMNDGSGSFRALTAPDLRKTSHASMSIAYGDVDGNGVTDIFVADMLPPEHSRARKTQVSTLVERAPPPGVVDATTQVNRNTLLLGLRGGGYAEAAQQGGVDASGWTWASELMDVDLDGHLDLVVANGHRWDPLDADTGERLRRTQATAGADWHEVIGLFPELRLRNQAFRNRGDGTFEAVEGAWGLDAGPDISHGMAAGDLDGDGDLDLVVNRLGDEALVLRNDTRAPRVAVRLVGRAPNTAAIGARVTVSAGSSTQSREIGAGGLYLSHSDALQSFAAVVAPVRIEVRWPDGSTRVVEGADADRLYEIRQPAASAAPVAEGAAGGATSAPPLFEAVALGPAHIDVPHDASRLQPLLPRHLSRLGPGVTWWDIDGDTDPDLVVGGGAGGRVRVVRNDGGRLSAGWTSPELPYDATTLLPHDGALLVGVSNYESASPEEARAAPPAWRIRVSAAGPQELREALTSDGSASGPLAAADVDLDGDLDVFLGGRAYQGAYPLVPRSRLFRRQRDGSLEYDSIASAPFDRVGLVSGALFTDVDADGDPDLVLALDWGPLRLFVNERGGFSDRTEAYGLAGLESWWNGVTAGDLDGDGLMDLVATSWGRNIGLGATQDRPLLAYWADFDRSGTLDVVLGRRDERIGAVAPLTGLPRLSSGLPYVRRQTVTTFGQYADASMSEVLGPSYQAARTSGVNTLDHVALLNRGGRFEAFPLPLEAQRAPAHGVAVADFDGDGHEDVVLAQNFFPNALGAERHDPGLGLLLLGDGTGGLLAASPASSGIRLSGDQRGLAVADFDGDARSDVAVGQNAGPVVVLRNRGGAPGLRVRLEGGPDNPRGVGATVRVLYANGAGPAREVRAGSGFWSVDDPVQVLGLREAPVAVEVRWPGGDRQRVEVASGATEVTVRR